MIWELNKYYKLHGKGGMYSTILIVKPIKYLGCNEKGIDSYDCKILYDNAYRRGSNWQGTQHSIHPKWWNFVKINEDDILAVAL